MIVSKNMSAYTSAQCGQVMNTVLFKINGESYAKNSTKYQF